ncbi:unnamed protein product [Staurois parvus]|uniref:Uncharacterized protein n=1 Tax=Staurois parvus TaxID=386267 RepID=A0ABN9HHG0_9NEOB|nr:unnamed protein product [Staurois parvus]
MYINGRMGAVQGRVAVYKRCLHSQSVRTTWEHATLIAVRDLCVRSRSCDHCSDLIAYYV